MVDMLGKIEAPWAIQPVALYVATRSTPTNLKPLQWRRTFTPEIPK